MYRCPNAVKPRDCRLAPHSAGFLAIVAFLFPAPLAAQERAVQAQPARQAVELESLDVRTRALLGSRNAEKRIASRLTHRDRLVARRIGQRLREGASFNTVRENWKELVSRSDPKDVDGLIQFVMREAYLERFEEERLAAERVERLKQRARTLREERGRLVERLNEIDDELATIGEDAQLANIDLQNALQKQQQTLQTMSNVSKSMHDTAKAIIQNMRG